MNTSPTRRLTMELVHTTKGLVTQSPKAAAVTVASCAVAIAALALLFAGVGSTTNSVAGATSAGSGGLTLSEWRYVQGIESLSPAQLVAAFGTESSVQTVDRLTPVQRLEAYGTNVQAAAALATLGPAERLYVETIMSMTPEQLKAVFGTSH
jgi:hypothetical protein